MKNMYAEKDMRFWREGRRRDESRTMGRWPTVVALSMLAFAAIAQHAVVAAGERHSGTVTAVDPQARTLIVEELAEEGEVKHLRVLVAPDTQLLLSERIPDREVTDFARIFRDTPLLLSQIRPGDFVNLDVERSDGALVARSITVTLRSE
jgi:hypothetical protein